MAIYPGAKKRLIPKWNKVKIARHRRMNLHVAVSEAASLFGMFSASNAACSHFYVAKDGTVEQYIDTDYRSGADMNGNDSTISVETQGGVKNPEGEPFTAAQVVALVALWKWGRDTHKIKNQVAINTQTNDNSAGLSWHRLGVEGNFAGRKGILSNSYKAGGIKYSSARGKICPGDAKILQIPGIWEAANGTVAPTISKPPVKAPAQSSVQPTNFSKLAVDGIAGKATIEALQIVMRAIKTYSRAVDGDASVHTWRAVQTWLQGLGYYPASKYLIDGKPGPATIKALQTFFVNKGHLNSRKWLIDGKFQKETIKALQRYLNTQKG